MEHSKGKIQIVYNGIYVDAKDGGKIWLATTCGMPVGYGSHVANAERLVKAWNEYDSLKAKAELCDELVEALKESEKRIKFLLDKILKNESFPEKIILERIEIDKSFSCMSYIKQILTKAERIK